MNEQDISKMFDNIAPVVSVKLIKDKVKSQNVGYGFVEFENWEVAKELF
jgi:RNA recognition motif-containing protein